ncbi:MAG: hypothetical protein RLZZ210_1080 [Pseudomonadota bacterium]|jgi:general secretion pathway protein H
MNKKKGYTLLELMIIIGIIGMTLIVVTLITKPSTPRQLLQDAEYLGDALEVIQQESQMQDKPIIITISQRGITTNADSRNNMLGDYKWNIDEIDSKLGWKPVKNQENTWQRTISQEPIQNPFHISLIRGNYKIILAGDGSGRYKTKTINLKYEDKNQQTQLQLPDNQEQDIKNAINSKKKNHVAEKHAKNHHVQ